MPRLFPVVPHSHYPTASRANSRSNYSIAFVCSSLILEPSRRSRVGCVGPPGPSQTNLKRPNDQRRQSPAALLRWNLSLGPRINSITHLQPTARTAFPCQPIFSWIAALQIIPAIWTLQCGLWQEHASDHCANKKDAYDQGTYAVEKNSVPIPWGLRKPGAEADDDSNNQPSSK